MKQAWFIFFTLMFGCGLVAAQNITGNWLGGFTSYRGYWQNHIPILLQITQLEDSTYHCYTHTLLTNNENKKFVIVCTATIEILKANRFKVTEIEDISNLNLVPSTLQIMWLKLNKKRNEFVGTWESVDPINRSKTGGKIYFKKLDEETK